MSQRLHIGKTEESFYDCILESIENAEDKLLSEFFNYKDGIFFGPWKIRIKDVNLFNEIQSILKKLFKCLGKQYPDDVCAFYQSNREINYPTEQEFLEWLYDETTL